MEMADNQKNEISLNDKTTHQIYDECSRLLGFVKKCAIFPVCSDFTIWWADFRIISAEWIAPARRFAKIIEKDHHVAKHSYTSHL
eukprot:6083016-Amphidinium_carterae.1